MGFLLNLLGGVSKAELTRVENEQAQARALYSSCCWDCMNRKTEKC